LPFDPQDDPSHGKADHRQVEGWLQATEDKDIHHDAVVEHDGAQQLIAEIQGLSPEDDYFDAKVTVLFEMIKHQSRKRRSRVACSPRRRSRRWISRPSARSFLLVSASSPIWVTPYPNVSVQIQWIIKSHRGGRQSAPVRS
jgi:hypothetical protein